MRNMFTNVDVNTTNDNDNNRNDILDYVIDRQLELVRGFEGTRT